MFKYTVLILSKNVVKFCFFAGNSIIKQCKKLPSNQDVLHGLVMKKKSEVDTEWKCQERQYLIRQTKSL
jgi:hypothetical protein